MLPQRLDNMLHETPFVGEVVPHLDNARALDDLEREVAHDVLHVHLQVLGLPRPKVRVRVAVVPRQRELLALDEAAGRALL